MPVIGRRTLAHPQPDRAAQAAAGDEARSRRATRSPPRPGRCSPGARPGSTSPTAGRAQATALGERLAALPIAAIYASPIERTTQTAEAVAAHHDLPVLPLPGVIEADYGEWTGGKIADLAKNDLWRTVQRAPSRARFPSGESLAEMQARMVDRAGARRRRSRGRDRRRGVARRPHQGRDRALHRDAPRPLPAHRRVAGIGHGAPALAARRGDAEVQRHRVARGAHPQARTIDGPTSGGDGPDPTDRRLEEEASA